MIEPHAGVLHIVSDTEVCEMWLQSKGCTMWADWIIENPDARRQAAEWFLDQNRQLSEFVRTRRWMNPIPGAWDVIV